MLGQQAAQQPAAQTGGGGAGVGTQASSDPNAAGVRTFSINVK
jgi:hypothetical protein